MSVKISGHHRAGLSFNAVTAAGGEPSTLVGWLTAAHQQDAGADRKAPVSVIADAGERAVPQGRP
jgi:hypothetical protein